MAPKVAAWVKNLLQCRRCRFDPWTRKIPWQPTPVFLSEKSHGQRSLAGYKELVGYKPREELDMIEVT